MLYILDTNVLVRYLVRDDVQQAEVARRILESLAAERPGFVCREVTVELVWVLNRSYDLSPQKIAAVLLELLATEGIVIESAGDVAHAALQYGTRRADFADLMILAAARRQGAHPIYTFDGRASRVDGVELLTVTET